MLQAIVQSHEPLGKFMSAFRDAFRNRPQYRHFQAYVVALLIYLGSRKITYPTRKLSDVVQRLGEGRFEARAAVSAAVTEIDILVRGINNMAEKLQQEQLQVARSL